MDTRGASTRRWLVAVMVAAAASATVADEGRAVPERLARDIAARAEGRGVPAEVALAPVKEAAARGVPPGPVGAKVLEGLAKGVPAERISAVARTLTDRLVTAGALLDEAGAAGLAAPADRAGAQADLAVALGEGVRREDVQELVRAARGGAGSADGVTSAALAVGELARRGVPPADALGLGRALARREARGAAAEVGALYEAWHAEGGREPRAFLDEATSRVEHGKPLDGMVDVFGESADRVVKGRSDDAPRAGGDAGSDGGSDGMGRGNGLGAGADHGASGTVPGAAKGKVPPGKAKGKR